MINNSLREANNNRKGVFMKIKYWIPILLIVLVFSLIGCATPKQVVVETVAITTVAAVTTIPETTAAPTTSTTTTTAETTVVATTTTTAEIVGEIPTIKLSVYEGPSYSTNGNVCYYRVKATVKGNPSPNITFSKDDSNGSLGKDKTQVNLTKTSPSYTLTSTAKNSAGQASDSLTLNWVEPTPTTEVSATTIIVETTVPETTAPETGSATLGEKNAAKKALDYLAYTSFSYSGLVGQLEYEGYTQEEAVYGVDRCGADWNKQAALKAKQYLDYTSFSRDELIAQLEFEGFTSQQAEYGVQAVGY